MTPEAKKLLSSTVRALRARLLGDLQAAMEGEYRLGVARVRDAFLTVNGRQHIDAWLMLGDNAYDNGTDAEYQKAVFDVFAPVLAN